MTQIRSHADDGASPAAGRDAPDLARAAHELRTPLLGMIGMAGLLLETPLSAEQATYAHAIKQSGEALLGLVGDVLDAARAEAGRLDLSLASVDLRRFFEDIVELMAPQADERGLEIAAYVAPDAPVSVRADAGRLRQVLMNLVGNAIKFTLEGGVALDLTVEDAAPDRARLVFSVRDTGPGIAPGDVERVFREFERAHAGEPGTGLGLAIARRLAAGMGGEIRLDRRDGGTTFSVVLDAEVERAAPARRDPLRHRNVLVISGGAVAPARLLRRLADLGADAAVAPTLAAALDLLDDPSGIGGPFDAALVDRPADAELGRALQTLAARRPELRLIVLTGPRERGALPALERAGAAAFLIKPVRSASLERILAAALDRKPVVGTAPPFGERGDEPDRSPSPRPPLHVLVAEDDEVGALLARALLERLGHRVTRVRDGAAAIAAFEGAIAAGQPFDAALVDLDLPGVDGCAAIRAIRATERQEGLPQCTVLAVSADDSPAAFARAMAAGADRRFAKPLDRNDLAALHLRALGNGDRSAG